MMDSKPLITVTVNSYNYSRFIGDCLHSIINQTYKNFELIVVDDCSEDDSYSIAKNFAKNDSRIEVIRMKKNGGIGKAKNEGIIRAKGEYIVTLDADDMMTPNSLEIRLEAMLKQQVSFVHADAILFNGEFPWKKAFEIEVEKVTDKRRILPRRLRCPTVYNIHAQSVFAHKSVYEKYGLYDEDLECKVDREMWLRLFGKERIDKPKFPTYFLNKCVAFYRWHSKQVTKKKQKSPEFWKKNDKLCEKKYLIRKKEGITKKNTRFFNGNK